MARANGCDSISAAPPGLVRAASPERARDTLVPMWASWRCPAADAPVRPAVADYCGGWERGLPMQELASADSARSAGASAPTVLRILLGTQLRRLRESRGISATAAATAIRGSESKISRIELGRHTVREVDIADLLDLYGISEPTERESLLTLAGQANQQGWWHHYQDVLPSWFLSYLGLEESAEFIRSYDTQFVPGLLQTEEYSKAVLELGGYPSEQTGRMVLLRKERQERFVSGGLRLLAVIDEIALRRPVGSPGTRRQQLEHLVEAAGQPGLTIQITPFGTGGTYAAPGSFSILSFAADDLPDVVYVEQLTSALYLDKRADVDRYAQAMDLLARTSTPPDQTPQFLHAMISEMQKQGESTCTTPVTGRLP
jgi:transcriptional regulator with XRE-family HTH domain